MTYLRAVGQAFVFLVAFGIVGLLLLLTGCTRGLEKMVP